MYPRTVAAILLSLGSILFFAGPAAMTAQAQAAAGLERQAVQEASDAAAAPAPGAAATAERRRPAAKSQAEYDAFQACLQEKDPNKQIRMVEDFLLEYPDTELKEYAFQAATQAYQAKNDYPKLLTYGEMTLEENADNLAALLILSTAIPERTSRSDPDAAESLAAAERYALRALELIPQMPRRASVTPEEWERSKKDAEAGPHAALGLIAMMREDFWKAEREFKLATELVTRPDPIALYRLGLAYSFQKRYDLALEALERSDGAGGVKISSAGGRRDLVAEAREFAWKAKAAMETPGVAVDDSAVDSSAAPLEEPGAPPVPPESETP